MGMVSYCASRRVSYNNTVITLYWICDMKKILMMFIIVFSLVFLPFIWAQEKTIDDFEKVPDDGWPSQVIYDTTNVCYNGTLRWIALGNPNLMNTPPPYHISRIMMVHCFCVIDKVRTEYKYKAYVDFIAEDNKNAPTLIPKLFMGKSLECIKEYGTLAGLVILDEDALKAFDHYAEDNETIFEKKDDSSVNSGKSDSPEQPEELPTEDSPIISF